MGAVLLLYVSFVKLKHYGGFGKAWRSIVEEFGRPN